MCKGKYNTLEKKAYNDKVYITINELLILS